MQRLEVSGAVRLIYRSLGAEGLMFVRDIIDVYSEKHIKYIAWEEMQSLWNVNFLVLGVTNEKGLKYDLAALVGLGLLYEGLRSHSATSHTR